MENGKPGEVGPVGVREGQIEAGNRLFEPGQMRGRFRVDEIVSEAFDYKKIDIRFVR